MKINEYLRLVREGLDQLDGTTLEKVVDVFFECLCSEKQVFVFGNGACAALASHMACDLGKITAANLGAGPVANGGQRLKIIGLADNTAWLTALGNDVSYDDVFIEQLKNFMRPKDVVVGLSASGGSPNVLRALEYAFRHHAITVGITGSQPKAEKMRPFCHICVQAPVTMIEQIEDFQVVFHHAVTRALVQRIEEQRAAGSQR